MPSPSPSPPPLAPTAAAPGTRATQLRKIYTSALAASLKSNSYPNFAACFPTPARYCPTALEGVWRQLNARLEEECLRDFEKILDERNAIQNLNAWDNILETAQRKRDRGIAGEEIEGKPAHLLDAKELNDAFMHNYLVKITQELEEKLKSAQHENHDIMTRITAQRNEIQSLVGGVERLVKDVEGAVGALQGGQSGDLINELRQEAWDMHNEVATAKQDG